MPEYLDSYTRSADHLELLSAGAWKLMAPNIADALSDIGRSDASVVELGAGTGLGTAVIARALPHARIVVVEPSSHLRAALFQRVTSSTDLRSRVTVENRPFPLSRIPEKFDALVMINSLGHLDADARTALWRTIAAGLKPGGCAIVNLQQPTTASAVPVFEMAREHVGDREYHGSAWAERIDDVSMRWHMTYRTSEDDRVIDTVDVDYLWNVLDEQGLQNELGPCGLRAIAFGDERAGLYRAMR